MVHENRGSGFISFTCINREFHFILIFNVSVVQKSLSITNGKGYWFADFAPLSLQTLCSTSRGSLPFFIDNILFSGNVILHIVFRE